MVTETIRGGLYKALGALALGLACTNAAYPLDDVSFQVAGEPAALGKSLRSSSLILAAKKAKRTDAQDLFADARAEYANLVNALYAQGYYSPVIHIFVDGREAANIAPLDAPAQISKIQITVDPGRLFTFAKAKIAPLAPKTDLPSGFAPGRPAESGQIIAAVSAGIDGWRALGHAKARVSAQDVVANHPTAQLSAEITLAPGQQLRFGRLKIKGQDRMRENRIRAITGLPEGAIYSPKELDRAKQRLRRTGVFKSVTLTEDDQITQPDLLGITATVAEQKRRRYTFGAELASLDGVTLNGAWLHRNLFGGAERLQISGEITNLGASTSGTDYKFGISLDRPATFGPDIGLGFATEIGRLDEADYTSDFFSISSTLTYIQSDQLTARIGLQYGYSAITDASGSFTYRHLALPIGATWDRRDSKTDATKGFYIDGEIKPFLGFGITDSGARLKLDLRGYKAIGSGNRFVLAARIQAGAILGARLLGTPRDDLFYSGGGGTVRGQPYQSLGVNVLRSGPDTFKTGGTQFLAGSLEARVKATEKIGIVGFVDAGRIDYDGFFAPTGNWHAGAGLGIRYATGVGPIRLDLAGPVGGTTGKGLQIYVGLGQAF